DGASLLHCPGGGQSMDIVLIRHDQRRRDVAEMEAGLTQDGKTSAMETAKRLQQLELNDPNPGTPRRLAKLTAILTSRHAAPVETAELLEAQSGAAIYKLALLTPGYSGTLTPAKLFSEANEESHDAVGNDDKGVLAIIGHEPTISGLLRSMTGKDSRALDR